MAKQVDTFKLGLTVIVIVALLFLTTLMIGGGDWFAPPTQQYEVWYPASSPLPQLLKPGAQIYCGMMEVGKVSNVRFDHYEEDKECQDVVLTVDVLGSLVLREDARIVASGPLLGGSGTLTILDPGTAEEIVKPGGKIQGAPSPSFDAIMAQVSSELDPREPESLMAMVKNEIDPANARSLMAGLHRTMADINAISADLRHQVDPRQRDALMAKLQDTMQNINLLSASLRDQMDAQKDGNMIDPIHTALDHLNLGLADAAAMLKENRPSIRNTVGDLEKTAGVVYGEIAVPIGQELDSRRKDSLLGKVHVSVDQVNDSLSDVNVVTEELKRVIIWNKPQINKIISNLATTSDRINATIAELALQPWLIFHKPTEAEIKRRNVFNASRQYVEAASRLEGSLSKLQAIKELREGDLPMDDAELTAIRAEVRDALNHFSEIEKAMWDQMEKITPEKKPES